MTFRGFFTLFTKIRQVFTGTLLLMTLIYLKSTQKSNSCDVPIGIKIPFIRVSVTIKPGCSLITVHYHELFDVTVRYHELFER